MDYMIVYSGFASAPELRHSFSVANDNMAIEYAKKTACYVNDKYYHNVTVWRDPAESSESMIYHGNIVVETTLR